MSISKFLCANPHRNEGTAKKKQTVSVFASSIGSTFLRAWCLEAACRKREGKQAVAEAHPEERALGCYAQLGPFIHLLFISYREREKEHKDIRNSGCFLHKNDGQNDLFNKQFPLVRETLQTL